MRASTYQRTAEFLIPPDDPKRPESSEKTGRYFFKGLDTLGSATNTSPYRTARGVSGHCTSRGREGLRRSH